MTEWEWWGDKITRIEQKVDRVLALLLRVQIQEGRDTMATQAALDKLAADVTKNTDAVASAAQALNGYVTTVADLTQKLQDALNSAGVDDPAVLAAAAAIEANNDTLLAAVPKVAQAVDANT